MDQSFRSGEGLSITSTIGNLLTEQFEIELTNNMGTGTMYLKEINTDKRCINRYFEQSLFMAILLMPYISRYLTILL